MKKTQYIKILSNPIVVLFGVFAGLIISQIIAALTLSLFTIESELLLGGLITLITLTVMGGIVWSLLQLSGSTWRAVGIVRPATGWLKKVVLYLGAYYLISYALQLIVTVLISQFDPTEAQDVGIRNYSLTVFAQSLVVLVVLTPLLEEFVFRGLFFRGLRRRTGFLFAAAASSVLFAVAHGQWNVALDTFVLGIFLAKLVEDTDSLVPAVAMHAGKNLIALSLLFALERL